MIKSRMGTESPTADTKILCLKAGKRVHCAAGKT